MSIRNSRVLGVALALPPVAVTTLLAGLVALQAFGVDHLSRAPALNIGEAAALPDPGAVVARLRAGDDPNRPVIVRYGLPTSTPVELRPLEAAVISQDPDMVDLLLRNGASIELVGLDRLVCLAERRDASDVADYLLTRARPASTNSPPVDCSRMTLPW
jgi:hypothetical protein